MAQDILIVDDEADIRDLVAGILQDEGYCPRVADNGFSAIEMIKARQPSLVILDVWLGDGERDGLKVLDIIKRDHPFVPVIMISGHGTIETAVAAIKKGAQDFIEKPFQTERLLVVIEKAIESAFLKRENAELRLKAGLSNELIGQTPLMNHMRQTIDKAGPTNSRVLISGPSGSGKETAARLLHAQSKRASAPLIIVNCGMLHPDHLEAELFGTEIIGQSADTPRKVGLIEQAHAGTLVLDEVTDLPLPTQAKLIRLLQENGFTRLGGSHRIEVDIRVIATASADMLATIERGNFREDLYYRLNVVPIQIPPLRDRVSDIPLLAQHFLNYIASSQNQAQRRFSDEALVVLQSYPWPGNVRQLKNVIEWVLIMNTLAPRETIRADMLPPEIRTGLPFNINNTGNADIVSLPLREAREVFEREYLSAQVNRFGGNISQTARFVGMERSALHRKLKSLGAINERAIVMEPELLQGTDG
jgi:two-component system nitrogen regulation response regulator NtrX